MLNCPCSGENANCFYCDGTGIKREQLTTIYFFKNQNARKAHSTSSKMDIFDLKNKFKSYSDSTLKSYKRNIFSEYLQTINYEKKSKLLEIIDFVTYELVWRKRNSNFSKKPKNNIQTLAANTSKKEQSKKHNPKKKSAKIKYIQNAHATNTQKETILGVKLSNYFKELPRQDIERKLDGSRDFYQFRESGKFGSHSSYDDYGDESFS